MMKQTTLLIGLLALFGCTHIHNETVTESQADDAEFEAMRQLLDQQVHDAKVKQQESVIERLKRNKQVLLSRIPTNSVHLISDDLWQYDEQIAEQEAKLEELKKRR